MAPGTLLPGFPSSSWTFIGDTQLADTTATLYPENRSGSGTKLGGETLGEIKNSDAAVDGTYWQFLFGRNSLQIDLQQDLLGVLVVSRTERCLGVADSWVCVARG